MGNGQGPFKYGVHRENDILGLPVKEAGTSIGSSYFDVVSSYERKGPRHI
jgi:hypothetical protein